jgi:GNAT superfamily N-acetyltransferase
MITVTTFDPKYKNDFKNLNIEWLKHYFYVEPIDEELLSNPEEVILSKGGYICFGLYNNEIAGTAALLKTNEHTYELGKMAVSPQFQGLGIGKAILAHCVETAIDLNAKEIILYSNTILATAIHMYTSSGFVEIPLQASNYKRSNIKMKLTL